MVNQATNSNMCLAEVMRARWNEWFRGGGSRQLVPNQLLIESIRGRAPGSALDVGSGSGRNAIHLAAAGWQVTAVDVAEEGLAMLGSVADSRKLAIKTLRADASALEWGKECWDLICLLYVGIRFFDKVEAALRPGGIVVVECFAQGDEGKAKWPDPASHQKSLVLRTVLSANVDAAADYTRVTRKLIRYVAEKQ
jgi:SAM-dependent methyltransferase